MKNVENDEPGRFDYPAANGPGMMGELTVVAAQLTAAAGKARDGDREATRAHIAHAVALLHGRRAESSHTSKPIYAEKFPFASWRGSWA